MRTALEIRDDVLEMVNAYAAARSISNGSAATELIERGQSRYSTPRSETSHPA